MLLTVIGLALAGGGVELGVQGGLVVAGPERLVEAPTRAGGGLWPRLTAWTGTPLGVELDAPLAWVPAGRLRVVGPRLTLLVDAAPSARVHPMLRLGVGVLDRRWAGHGLEDVPDPLDRWAPAGHLGVAVGVPVLGALQVRAQLDATATSVQGLAGRQLVPGMELTIGLGTRFEVRRDGDHDLVPDRSDACPDRPEDLDGHADEDGCPDPDDDLDGVRDELDACDDAPEDMDGVDDEDGCPE